MKINPTLVESVFKFFIILTILSCLSLCAYSGYKTNNEQKLRLIPTPENIQRWHDRKLEYLQGFVCEEMLREIDNFKDKGTPCRISIDVTIAFYKKYYFASKLQEPWFDLVGIPDEFRSMDDINLNSNNLTCNNQILEKWKACPTGYEFKNK